MLKLAVSLRRCHKFAGNALIERSSGVGTRVSQLRQPQFTQVAEITELNCYNRYFLEERYAIPLSNDIHNWIRKLMFSSFRSSATHHLDINGGRIGQD
jgi:hypothetical protein